LAEEINKALELHNVEVGAEKVGLHVNAKKSKLMQYGHLSTQHQHKNWQEDKGS